MSLIPVEDLLAVEVVYAEYDLFEDGGGEWFVHDGVPVDELEQVHVSVLKGIRQQLIKFF